MSKKFNPDRLFVAAEASIEMAQDVRRKFELGGIDDQLPLWTPTAIRESVYSDEEIENALYFANPGVNALGEIERQRQRLLGAVTLVTTAERFAERALSGLGDRALHVRNIREDMATISLQSSGILLGRDEVFKTAAGTVAKTRLHMGWLMLQQYAEPGDLFWRVQLVDKNEPSKRLVEITVID